MTNQDPWKVVDPFGVGGDARAMLRQIEDTERARKISEIGADPVTLKAVDPNARDKTEIEASAKFVDNDYRQRWHAYGW